MIVEKKESFICDTENRVDKVASSIVPRSIFSQADTKILVNGKSVKKSQKVKVGDKIDIVYNEETFEGLLAEDIKLDVVSKKITGVVWEDFNVDGIMDASEKKIENKHA